jgi:two-component system sensor histidine kinase DegS
MSLPPPQTKEFVDRLTSLAGECREELTRGTQSIQEIDLLLRQTRQEVDRLAQRESQQNLRLREIETSLESFNRTDIRDSYVAAHEIQMRLFIMRSQIEQLEARRQSITEQQEKLRILLDLAEINRDQEQDEGDDRTKLLPGTRTLVGSGDMFAQLIEARERERERIARQLTDGPAQVMANLILRTQVLERVQERAPDQLNDEITGIEAMATRSLLDIRRSIFEMRPLVLDELGLVPTLRRYSNDFARENGAKISVDGPENDGTLGEHTRIVVFRLVQQAMVAMVAPDAGTTLIVRVQLEDAQLVMRLDATELGADAPRSISRYVDDAYTAESLEMIGATLQRETLPNGERISIVLPLSQG